MPAQSRRSRTRNRSILLGHRTDRRSRLRHPAEYERTARMGLRHNQGVYRIGSSPGPEHSTRVAEVAANVGDADIAARAPVRLFGVE